MGEAGIVGPVLRQGLDQGGNALRLTLKGKPRLCQRLQVGTYTRDDPQRLGPAAFPEEGVKPKLVNKFQRVRLERNQCRFFLSGKGQP
jgi:hypothetical protein